MVVDVVMVVESVSVTDSVKCRVVVVHSSTTLVCVLLTVTLTYWVMVTSIWWVMGIVVSAWTVVDSTMVTLPVHVWS